MAENTTIKHLAFDGFEYDFDPSVVDDMEFLEFTEKIENGEIQYYPKLVIKMIGEDSYVRAKEHFTKKYGKFSVTKCGELFNQSIAKADPKE